MRPETEVPPPPTEPGFDPQTFHLALSLSLSLFHTHVHTHTRTHTHSCISGVMVLPSSIPVLRTHPCFNKYSKTRYKSLPFHEIKLKFHEGSWVPLRGFPFSFPTEASKVSAELTLSPQLRVGTFIWRLGVGAVPDLSLEAPALSKQPAGGGVCKARVYWFPPEVSSPAISLEPRAVNSLQLASSAQTDFPSCRPVFGEQIGLLKIPNIWAKFSPQFLTCCVFFPLSEARGAGIDVCITWSDSFVSLLPSRCCSWRCNPGHIHVAPVLAVGQKVTLINARKWTEKPTMSQYSVSQKWVRYNITVKIQKLPEQQSWTNN